jgi:hypothetical protein
LKGAVTVAQQNAYKAVRAAIAEIGNKEIRIVVAVDVPHCNRLGTRKGNVSIA